MLAKEKAKLVKFDGCELIKVGAIVELAYMLIWSAVLVVAVKLEAIGL